MRNIHQIPINLICLFLFFSYIFHLIACFLDTEAIKPIEKTDENVPVIRSNKVSSICLNIPAAGLGSRPSSIISTTTSDEGGFNEPYPEIKAKLKPHDNNYGIQNQNDSNYVNEFDNSIDRIDNVEDLSKLDLNPDEEFERTKMDIVSDPLEPLYAVPYKPNKHKIKEQSSLQKSIDSDIMYNSNRSSNDTILSKLDSQESFEKSNEENNGDSTLYNSSSSKDSEVFYQTVTYFFNP